MTVTVCNGRLVEIHTKARKMFISTIYLDFVEWGWTHRTAIGGDGIHSNQARNNVAEVYTHTLRIIKSVVVTAIVNMSIYAKWTENGPKKQKPDNGHFDEIVNWIVAAASPNGSHMTASFKTKTWWGRGRPGRQRGLQHTANNEHLSVSCHHTLYTRSVEDFSRVFARENHVNKQ